MRYIVLAVMFALLMYAAAQAQVRCDPCPRKAAWLPLIHVTVEVEDE